MIGSSLAKPFPIYRSSHGYMHMRIQLTPSGHYILGFNPSLQLMLEFVILINNLLICRTVQSTLRVNCRYGLFAFHPHPISQYNVNEVNMSIYLELVSFRWTTTQWTGCLSRAQSTWASRRLSVNSCSELGIIWLLNEQTADDQSVNHLTILLLSAAVAAAISGISCCNSVYNPFCHSG